MKCFWKFKQNDCVQAIAIYIYAMYYIYIDTNGTAAIYIVIIYIMIHIIILIYNDLEHSIHAYAILSIYHIIYNIKITTK